MSIDQGISVLTEDLAHLITQMGTIQNRLHELAAKQKRDGQPQTLAVSAAAAKIGVSRATMYRMVTNGEVVTITTGATTKIPLWWVEHHVQGGQTRNGKIVQAEDLVAS